MFEEKRQQSTLWQKLNTYSHDVLFDFLQLFRYWSNDVQWILTITRFSKEDTI